MSRLTPSEVRGEAKKAMGYTIGGGALAFATALGYLAASALLRRPILPP